MKGMLRRGVALCALAIVLTGLGCETAIEPVAPDQIEVQSGQGLLGRLLGITKLELVKSTLSLTEEVVSAVIGPNGGEISLGGHTLTVREGSVLEPTLFVMTVLSDGYVMVDLQALDPGRLLNVGASGFEVPVQLSLSYRDADVSDPEKLTIVHVRDDGSRVAIPSTVDTRRQVVRANLDHFSRYALCTN